MAAVAAAIATVNAVAVAAVDVVPVKAVAVATVVLTAARVRPAAVNAPTKAALSRNRALYFLL
jgi:hypothetical protein